MLRRGNAVVDANRWLVTSKPRLPPEVNPRSDLLRRLRAGPLQRPELVAARACLRGDRARGPLVKQLQLR